MEGAGRCLGRGDDTLLIEDRAMPVIVPAVQATPPASAEDGARGGREPRPGEARPLPRRRSFRRQQIRPEPALFVPARPPDDPGVAQVETDVADVARTPAAAQIR